MKVVVAVAVLFAGLASTSLRVTVAELVTVPVPNVNPESVTVAEAPAGIVPRLHTMLTVGWVLCPSVPR
jgi:hypothetical protein